MTPKGVIPAPNINVTPLIDVLLVLLIIFMVAAPLKPHRFLAKLPSVPLPRERDVPPDPLTLVVTIEPDRTLKLNGVTDMGTVYDVSPLALKLKTVFEDRIRNRAYRYDLASRTDLQRRAAYTKDSIHQGSASSSLRRRHARSRRPQGNRRRSHRPATRRPEINLRSR